MTPLKQALIQFKNSWRNSLLLGLGGTLLILAARHIPYLSAFVLGIGLLFLQEIANQLSEKNTWPKNFRFIQKNLLAYTATSLVLLPTIVLSGSGIGLLQSPQDFAIAVPAALVLFILSIYFYFILSQSLQLHLQRKVKLARAIDMVTLLSFKNLGSYLVVSFYISVLMVISGLTWGAGFIITLPLLFYSDYYLFGKMNIQELTVRAPQAGPQ